MINFFFLKKSMLNLCHSVCAMNVKCNWVGKYSIVQSCCYDKMTQVRTCALNSIRIFISISTWVVHSLSSIFKMIFIRWISLCHVSRIKIFRNYYFLNISRKMRFSWAIFGFTIKIEENLTEIASRYTYLNINDCNLLSIKRHFLLPPN